MVSENNNSLLIIAIIAVVISALALFVSYYNISMLSGVMLAPGTTNVTIEQNVAFQLLTDKIIWGNSSFPSGSGGELVLEQLDTNQSATVPDVSIPNAYWSRNSPNGDKNTTGFLIRNTGNMNISLSTVAQTATQYIGGGGAGYATPEFGLKMIENQTGVCGPGSRVLAWGPSWTSFTGSGMSLCTQFNYRTGNNTLEMHIHIGIPKDAQPGERVTTIQIAGVAAS